MHQGNGIKTSTAGNITSMVIAFALSRGITHQEIRAITGLTSLALANPANRLPDDVAHKLWKTLGEREPNEPLPLTMARGAPLEQLGHAFQYARNVREGILFFCRHGKVATDRLCLEFTEHCNSGHLFIKHPLDDLDQGRMTIFALAYFKRVVDDIVLNPIKIYEFRCAYPSPGPIQDYELYFGCPTYFDSSETALVISRQSLEEPLRLANSEIYEFSNEYFDQALQNLGHTIQLGEFERLHAAIAANARVGIFDSSSAATVAHMSQRKAQRIAAKHDTSVKSLISEIRMSMAKEMIRNPKFEIEEISEFLGYADESSFRRAFKSWTGKTPVAFRVNS